MNLKKVALVAEIIGGIGVVIGLVFVGLERRQNTNGDSTWSRES